MKPLDMIWSSSREQPVWPLIQQCAYNSLDPLGHNDALLITHSSIGDRTQITITFPTTPLKPAQEFRKSFSPLFGPCHFRRVLKVSTTELQNISTGKKSMWLTPTIVEWSSTKTILSTHTTTWWRNWTWSLQGTTMPMVGMHEEYSS